MIATFATSPTNILSAQPIAAGEKIIARSTNAADTMNLTITGTVSGSPDSEVIALTGKKEVQSTKTYSAIGSLTLASGAAGTVNAYSQGVAGSGDARVDTVPATGTTITLGLTGYTQAYTYRSPARLTIQTVAVASLGQGDYFDVVDYGGATHRFWFDIDAAGTGAPLNPDYLSEVDVVTGDTAAQVATKLNTAITGADLASVMVNSVSTDTITLTGIFLGTGSLADGAGAAATTFTLTSVQAGTADAAYQVRTGYHTDGTAITTAQVATNLSYAINDATGTEGMHYGSGTVAHTHLTATVITNVVTLRDNLAIGRQLFWANAQSSTHHTLRQITGATTGNTIANIRASITQVLSASVSLDTENLDVATLPAGVTPTSDWVLVNGHRFTLVIAAAQTASALAFKYQTANTVAGVARDGDTSISITTTSATASDRNKLVTPSELAQYVRLVVTSNPNTLDTKVNAKVIYG